VQGGGRVYLTKDSRLDPSCCDDVSAPRGMAEHTRHLDPRGVLHSDMERRLDLTGVGRKRS
jgi:hypothetical protein